STVDGGPWRTTTLKALLTNPRLIGKRAHHGEVIADAVWKPILTETQQVQVIARLAARQSSGRRAPRRYLLSGMLRCGKCGNRLFSSP
ncbi:recombinase family protein, partial [Parvimonas micra]|uniref:recombinase family protein n=1 Tax=Parvimonas micra TaxID=33033 RepID=UPI002B4A9AFF